MKVILTGSTGFIGNEVLHQAIAHPSISSIVCILRRPLSESLSSNPKVKTIILDDFMNYPPEVMAQLEGAEACIWALGLPATKFPRLEDAQRVEIDYSRAHAEAFTTLASKIPGKRFRVVLCSGQGAERDTNKKLWFLHHARINKGHMENNFLAQAEKQGSNLDISVMRPGGVLGKGAPVPDIVTPLLKSLKVDELAAAMVDEAVNEKVGGRTLECGELREKGREVLRRAVRG